MRDAKGSGRRSVPARNRIWRTRLLRTKPGRLALNVRAALSGQDLLREHRRVLAQNAELEQQRDQAEFIVRSIIERHYCGAELPPPHLRSHVGVNEHALKFWSHGISSSRLVLQVFGPSPAGPVLDWGCGPGRTLVWLRNHPAWRRHYHGCDVDAEAIAWLRGHGETRVAVSGDLPPLPHPDGYFTGLFAFSVLSHIPADRHASWYREFHRVLAPGGRILVTTHGAWHAATVPASIREEFERRGAAWLPSPVPAHYKDSSMVSEAFTRRVLEGYFEVEQFANGYGRQDVVIARRLPNRA